MDKKKTILSVPQKECPPSVQNFSTEKPHSTNFAQEYKRPVIALFVGVLAAGACHIIFPGQPNLAISAGFGAADIFLKQGDKKDAKDPSDEGNNPKKSCTLKIEFHITLEVR